MPEMYGLVPERRPVRMCLGCRKRFFKADLARHTLDAENNLKEDPEQIRPGRGFYMCGGEECRAKMQSVVLRAVKGRQRHER
ncbi:MAG: YlxR family protein [Deltaproteobacteria bacterium]|jgi:predicted RNA-binding protein YlxR (DUF448 family)|nr:YlxR family protein [Deltaproteobacteria bacterium]